MLIVIPVSSADSELIAPFSKALRHFGTQTGHDALIVARPSDKELAASLFANLEGLFDKVSVKIFPQDGPIGWPKGPNFYWASTVHLLQTELRINTPWLWMELDTTPLTEGWASALLTEYNLNLKPFMGTVVTTQAVDNEGKPAEAGKHLVGVAVYPPSVGAFSVLWRFVSQMDTPFDVVCQWEMVPHTHNTALMQHGFRTKNYNRTADGVRGEDHNDLPKGVRFNEPVSEQAVLFHGCDDGSLAELLVEKTAPDLSQKVTEICVENSVETAPALDADLLCPPPKRRAKIAE